MALHLKDYDTFIPAATSSKNGLMSANDKAQFDQNTLRNKENLADGTDLDTVIEAGIYGISNVTITNVPEMINNETYAWSTLIVTNKNGVIMQIFMKPANNKTLMAVRERSGNPQKWLAWKKIAVGDLGNYLPLAGGKMTGQIELSPHNGNWIDMQTKAGISMKSYSGWSPIFSQKSTDGAWGLGTFSNNEMNLVYVTDENIANKSNNSTAHIVFRPDNTTSAIADKSKFLAETAKDSFIIGAQGGIQYYDADFTNQETTVDSNDWNSPIKQWCQIVHIPLSVKDYYHDIALPVNEVSGIRYRQRRNGHSYGWYKLVDDNNYASAIPAATTEKNGLMSKEDKVTLDKQKVYNSDNPSVTNELYKLGHFTMSAQGDVLIIEIYGGAGQNANTNQDTSTRIFIKKGWQQTASATKAFGTTVEEFGYPKSPTVYVMAKDNKEADVYIQFPYGYPKFSMTYICCGNTTFAPKIENMNTTEAPTEGTANPVELISYQRPITIAGIDMKDNITTSELANALKTAIGNLMYPVGSIYISVKNTNPSSLFGGSWTSFGSGRVLRGTTSSAESTGGSNSLTMNEEDVPSHKHYYYKANDTSGGHYLSTSEIPSHWHNNNVSSNDRFNFVNSTDNSTALGISSSAVGHDYYAVATVGHNGWYYIDGLPSTQSTGGGGAHTHPIYSGSDYTWGTYNSGGYSNNTYSTFDITNSYITVFMWKRTA